MTQEKATETSPILVVVRVLSETEMGLIGIDLGEGDETHFCIMQPNGDVVAFKLEDFKKIMQSFQFLMAESALAKRDLN